MLAFSNDYYGMIFRATQSVELFCAYGGRNYLSPAAPDSSRVWREVAADAVGKGVCVYTQRLYEGYDKLYHQTPGRDVYGRSDC